MTLILMALFSFVGAKAQVIPSTYYSTVGEGTYYLYNVSQGRFLERLGNNFPGFTQTPTTITLTADGNGYTIQFGDGKYMHTGYWNGQYLWTDGANNSAGIWSFVAIDALTNTYQMKRTEEETYNGITGTFYANGTNASTTVNDDCQWALITEAGYYNYLASSASIPATYFTTTLVAGRTYYLYSPYASCFLYPTSDRAGFQNTPAEVTLTANGEDFNIQFSNEKYLKYDAVSAGNTWANGTVGEAWAFSSFHGATGLFSIKHVTANSYLYAKNSSADAWGGECWGTPDTNNTRYAWALISAEDYANWQNSFVLNETDAVGFSATRDIFNVNPTVKRAMTAGAWNTLVVPFDMAIPSGWTVKEPTGFSGGELTFSDASSIVAGKPYLVKPTEAVTSFSATGVTLKKDLNPTTVDDLTMTGTYTAGMVPTGSYIIGIVDGQSDLYHVDSEVSIKPFRAYFTVAGTNPARIRTNLDNESTGIESVSQKAKGAGVYYNLAGQRVTTPTRGIYIVNGKKVMVK